MIRSGAERIPRLVLDTSRQRRTGMAVPVNDMWIAAAAMECGGHLLTFDLHFERISGLERTVLAA